MEALALTGPEAFIGLMSGTSLDGIDAVLVGFPDNRYLVYAELHHDYPTDLRAELVIASRGPERVTLPVFANLDGRVADEFAAAANAVLSIAAAKNIAVVAIGSHGQTVFHTPDSAAHSTVQLGDPARIAVRTGVTVVGDFRRGDMALGGQGAPLVPAFHQYAFGVPDGTRAIVNIGGIANLSVLRPNQPVIAFDTGPGNTLLDAWCSSHNGSPYDAGGRYAASGQVCAGLLATLLNDPYFARRPPKSTGVDYFSPAWLRERISQAGASQPPAPQDIQATLAELTAASIAGAITGYDAVTAVGICGGGAANDDLVARLRRLLPDLPLNSTAEWGLHPGLVEASAFGWFARERLAGRPSSLPSVTGATAPISMGGVYLPPGSRASAASYQV
ncbi:MAG: anhydro-N-acetylmuramic acid kinase [Gammaproteobacteria bacterium]